MCFLNRGVDSNLSKTFNLQQVILVSNSVVNQAGVSKIKMNHFYTKKTPMKTNLNIATRPSNIENTLDLQ